MLPLLRSPSCCFPYTWMFGEGVARDTNIKCMQHDIQELYVSTSCNVLCTGSFPYSQVYPSWEMNLGCSFLGVKRISKQLQPTTSLCRTLSVDFKQDQPPIKLIMSRTSPEEFHSELSATESIKTKPKPSRVRSVYQRKPEFLSQHRINFWYLT